VRQENEKEKLKQRQDEIGMETETEIETKRVRVKTMLSYWDEDRCNPRRRTRKIQFRAGRGRQAGRQADRQAGINMTRE
jgi:hypothetical protein